MKEVEKMKKILLFNPGIGSLNRGDEIISSGVIDNLEFILEQNYVTNISTHTPLNLLYVKHLRNYDYKFVCGSNLLMGKMNKIFRQWDINPITAIAAKNCILVGAGWWQQNDKPNFYTKILYRKIFNNKYIHSVRDEYTKKMLESIGISNVINTGCATMWKFTPEYCSTIPRSKSKNVIFTITDYNKDPENDNKMLDILIKNYENVYFWIQGEGDFEYVKQLRGFKKIKIIGNTLSDYDKFLENNDCDYIGTRLHGGIRALQKGKRTMIIAIDNRAREKKKDFNLPCIERNNIDELINFIKNDYVTDIKIPIDNIKKWKDQFKED